MAGGRNEVVWLDTLEAEFDSIIREIYQDLSELPQNEGEFVALLSLVKRRAMSLASALGQLVHKSRVLYQKSNDKKIRLENLDADLVQAKSANSVLARELRSRTLQVRSLELQLRSRDDDETKEFSKDMDSLRAQLEFELECYRQSPAEEDKLRSRLEQLEEENKALHMCVQGLYCDLAASSIGTSYMEMELAGRIQQLQLLVKGVSGPELKQLWHQIYTEISLQKNKRLLLAYQARDRKLDLLVAHATPSAVHDKELRQKVLEFASQRKLDLPKGRDIREVVILKKETESLGMSITGGTQLATLILISNMEEGKPAHSSRKLHIGDAVLSVNDQSLVNKSHEEAVHLLRKCGSKVVVKVIFMLGVTDDNDGGNVAVGPDPNDTDVMPGASQTFSSESKLSQYTFKTKTTPTSKESHLSAAAETVLTLSSQIDDSPEENTALSASDSEKLAASFCLLSSTSSPSLAGDVDSDIPMFSHNEVRDYEGLSSTPAGSPMPVRGHRSSGAEYITQWQSHNVKAIHDGDSIGINEEVARSDCTATSESSEISHRAVECASEDSQVYDLQVHVLPVSVQTLCNEGPHSFRTDT